MERRRFLFVVAIAGAGGAGLLGCGGSGAPDGIPAAPAPAPAVWDPSPLLFITGHPGSIDLSLTLPPAILRGGTFSLAPSSSALPPQISLAPNGILSTTDPVEGMTPNVFFTYVEPG